MIKSKMGGLCAFAGLAQGYADAKGIDVDVMLRLGGMFGLPFASGIEYAIKGSLAGAGIGGIAGAQKKATILAMLSMELQKEQKLNL